MLVKSILILLLLNILFIGCGSGGSASSSEQSINTILDTSAQDNTNLAFSIPFFQGENTPLEEVEYINH